MKNLAYFFVACALLAAAPAALPQTYEQPEVSKSSAAARAEWKELMHAVAEAVTAQRGCTADESQLTILDAAIFSKHGPSVALIGGCHGNAKQDALIAMRLEAGQPVFVEFRDADGAPVTPELYRRSTATSIDDTQLSPHTKSIATTSDRRNDHGQALGCSARVYVWNSRTNTFNWGSRRTKLANRASCSNRDF